MHNFRVPALHCIHEFSAPHSARLHHRAPPPCHAAARPRSPPPNSAVRPRSPSARSAPLPRCRPSAQPIPPLAGSPNYATALRHQHCAAYTSVGTLALPSAASGTKFCLRLRFFRTRFEKSLRFSTISTRHPHCILRAGGDCLRRSIASNTFSKLCLTFGLPITKCRAPQSTLGGIGCAYHSCLCSCSRIYSIAFGVEFHAFA